MIVIACLDDNGGMMFNHRRQSQDRMLRAHIAALVGDARLWMNHYSAQQFDAESIQHLIRKSSTLLTLGTATTSSSWHMTHTMSPIRTKTTRWMQMHPMPYSPMSFAVSVL